MTNTPALRAADGNHDTGLLKCIALICMIADHAGVIFFDGVYELRVIGRIAFPLYAWCLVIGLCHTRNAVKYVLRIFLMGLISQPFYMAALNHGLDKLNVMFTLGFALLGMIGMEKKRNGSHIWAPILCVLLGCFVHVDYGWRGILLPILLYAVKERRKSITALFFIFCLFWGNNSIILHTFFGMPVISRISFLPYGASLFQYFARLQFWAILALPFICMRKNTFTRFPKWLGYAAYPGHLAVLYLLRLCLHI